MKVGLFFGSFNPIHHGHLIMASHIVEHTDLDQLWFVVSPHNPHKKKSTLASDYDRLHLVEVAIKEDERFKPCDVEFSLPKPSYTIDTLTYLSEKHPKHDFSLIIGGDNLKSFPKWKNYEMILEKYNLVVYQRPSYDLGELITHPSVTILSDAPMMQISSTMIRKLLKEKRSVSYLMPNDVINELDAIPFYSS